MEEEVVIQPVVQTDSVPYSRFRRRVTTAVGTESRTHQSFKEETDINNIMRKYRDTGLVEHVNSHRGDYGDFTNTPADYHEALNQVIAADAMFLTLPADLRARFNNDPGAFLAFTEDPANEDAMRDLGLLPSERAAEQPPVRKLVEKTGEQPAEGAVETPDKPAETS